MRFHKSETSFFILIVLLGGVGILLYRIHAVLGEVGAGDITAEMQYLINILYVTNLVASLFLAAAILCGALLIYPQIRSQVQDHGKLQIMTRNLSARSESLEHAALTDSLTGLQNRRYFDDALREYLQQFNRIGRPVGLMIIDIDHFKRVNDTYGHDAGDVVLQEVAHCVRNYTRYHDVVARLGGEEFAILAPNLDGAMLIKLADRIRKAIGNLSIDVGAAQMKVTVSVGLAVWDHDESDKDFYRRADKMLYAAKNTGRNRVCA